MSELSRRDFIKGATTGAVSLAALGMLAGCGSSSASSSSDSTSSDSTSTAASTSTTVTKAPAELPTVENSTNFDVVTTSATTVGTTYENLMSALKGETKATTKYASYADIAAKAGYDQVSRLFKATSDAEKIHIELEFALASKIDSTTQRPTAEAPAEEPTDLNLISGITGEIYETSDMYPSFIKVAQSEGNADAVQVFSRAKLAEGYHAQRYADLYNTLDHLDGQTYYLCPICGYIHKGTDIESCPICGTAFSAFKSY